MAHCAHVAAQAAHPKKVVRADVMQIPLSAADRSDGAQH
jgi:hypothetical protein